MMACVSACNMLNVQAHCLWAGHGTRCLQVTGPTLPHGLLSSQRSGPVATLTSCCSLGLLSLMQWTCGHPHILPLFRPPFLMMQWTCGHPCILPLRASSSPGAVGPLLLLKHLLPFPRAHLPATQLAPVPLLQPVLIITCSSLLLLPSFFYPSSQPPLWVVSVPPPRLPQPDPRQTLILPAATLQYGAVSSLPT